MIAGHRRNYYPRRDNGGVKRAEQGDQSHILHLPTMNAPRWSRGGAPGRKAVVSAARRGGGEEGKKEGGEEKNGKEDEIRRDIDR